MENPKIPHTYKSSSLDELNPGVAIDLADKLTELLPASKNLQRTKKTRKTGKQQKWC